MRLSFLPDWYDIFVVLSKNKYSCHLLTIDRRDCHERETSQVTNVVTRLLTSRLPALLPSTTSTTMSRRQVSRARNSDWEDDLDIFASQEPTAVDDLKSSFAPPKRRLCSY
jgi:hypothetical protein